ncbi:MAG: hypothetical protein WB460_04180 [Candidatus Acidiferrales bacterium]
MSLLILRVDALANGNKPHSTKIKALKDCKGVFRIARKAAAVIHENYVKRFGLGNRSRHEITKPRTVCSDATKSLIDVNMLVQELETARDRVLPALSQLIFNRGRAL